MRAWVLSLPSSNVEYELTCLDNLDWGQLEQLLWVCCLPLDNYINFEQFLN